MRNRLLGITLSIFFYQGCSDDPAELAAPPKTPRSICLASLTETGKAQLAIKDCEFTCLADEANPDRVACGAMALAHFQSVVDEVGSYVGLLKPSQSPGDIAIQVQSELTSRIRTQADLRTFVNQFLGGIIKDLRGIREGVYYAVGGGESVTVPIAELPLNEALLSFVYGRAESFSLKGEWTERELVLLGATANGLLSAIDLIMAHNLNVNVSKVPDLDGIGEWISFAIQLLEDEKDLLSVDSPTALENARHEFHAVTSLLAGREETKENVAQSNPGFLAMLNESLEKQLSGANAVDSPSVFKLTDIDGDQELSRGDNMVLVLKVNGEEVTFGFIYPFSKTLTEDVFQFLTDINTNLDGNKIPVHISPLYNSFVRELGVFSAVAPVQLDSMPDAVALDFDAFFTNFIGIRHLLPYWYEDKASEATDTLNPLYLEDVSAPTIDNFFAYERELDGDADHFLWASTTDEALINWYNFDAPGGFLKDGLEPKSGHYFLFQDPAFAGLLNVDTSPFENNSYDLSDSITTDGEFMPSKNNQMTNAIINALIIWASE